MVGEGTRGQSSEVATKHGVPWPVLILHKAWALKSQLQGRPNLEGPRSHVACGFQTELLRTLGSSSGFVGMLPHSVLQLPTWLLYLFNEPVYKGEKDFVVK